jgi:hypothetical protein
VAQEKVDKVYRFSQTIPANCHQGWGQEWQKNVSSSDHSKQDEPKRDAPGLQLGDLGCVHLLLRIRFRRMAEIAVDEGAYRLFVERIKAL